MRKTNRTLALILCLVMLLSIVPMPSLAANLSASELDDIVSFNLGDYAVSVGQDEAMLEAEEISALFEPDGSYTIELEENAYFPYQIQLTKGDTVSEEWFMTPEDSVEFAGHTFYVHSETSGDVLTQIGVWVDDVYIPAYPEEKDFEARAELLSMMPLKEHYVYLDLSSFLPAELSKVKISTILGNLTTSRTENEAVAVEGTVAVWTKWGSDAYTILEDDYLDLSNKPSSLELIVGAADQLNLENERYYVTFTYRKLNDLFDATLYSSDDPREKISIYTCNVISDSYIRYNELYITVNEKQITEDTSAYYLGLSLGEGFSDITAIIYEGYYETEDDIPADAVEITDQILDQTDLSSEGGYLVDIASERVAERPQITVLLKRSEETAMVLPLYVYIMGRGLSLSCGNYVYAVETDATRTEVGYWNYNRNDEGYIGYICRLPYGTPADGTYYFNLRMNNPDPEVDNSNYGIANVKKAVQGEFSTFEAAENEEDIKDQLFSDPSKSGGGYTTDLSQGVTFTVFDTNDDVHTISLKTEELPADPDLEPDPDPIIVYVPSDETYFNINSVLSPNTAKQGYIYYYKLPVNADSYYSNGYQTLLLLQSLYDSETNEYIYGAVVEETVVPTFSVADGATVHAALRETGSTVVLSGETEVPFESGKAIEYSVTAESNNTVQNYWVSLLTQQSGSSLFVNGTNDATHQVTVETEDGEVVRAQREMLLYYPDSYHDVAFINIGDEPITGLYVELDAQGVELDPYWTIGETTTLSAFTTTNRVDEDGNHVSYGQLANIGKIRILPSDEDSAGLISGTLKIGYTGDGTEPVEETIIQLSGFVGQLRIITGELIEEESSTSSSSSRTPRNSELVYKIEGGVKYVPYSQLIQTNWMYGNNNVTFEITSGELPEGLELREKTGEIYGVPLETGEDYEFTIRATATYVSSFTGEIESFTDSRTYRLTILDNTDENVDAATDDDYEVNQEETDDELLSRLVTINGQDLIFASNGPFDEFVAFYIDGKKQTIDVDYLASAGSTLITILSEAVKETGKDTHTIAIEFRDSGEDSEDVYSPLHRTAINYTAQESSSNQKPQTPSYSNSNGNPLPSPIYNQTLTPPSSSVDQGGIASNQLPTESDTQVPSSTEEGEEPSASEVLELPLFSYIVEETTAKVEDISAEDFWTLNYAQAITIDVSSQSGLVDTIILPAELVRKLATIVNLGEEPPTSVKLILDTGAVTLDNNALASVAEQIGGADLTIYIPSAAIISMSEEQNEVTEQMSISGAFHIEMTAESTIVDFSGGKIELSIPFDLPEAVDQRDYAVWYISTEGEHYLHRSDYENGYMIIRTNHLSVFVVGHDPLKYSFKDLADGAWYISAIDLASRTGMMIGTGVDQFSPEAVLTRGMVAQILYNQETPQEDIENQGFVDVTENNWYYCAVNWVASAGIMQGTGQNRFEPEVNITREQLAQVLFNYAAWKDYSTDGSVEMAVFSDRDQVSDWADRAMRWAVYNKIINGMGDGTLRPDGYATRAQMAMVLSSFKESFEP